jgi:hypothetical protein
MPSLGRAHALLAFCASGTDDGPLLCSRYEAVVWHPITVRREMARLVLAGPVEEPLTRAGEPFRHNGCPHNRSSWPTASPTPTRSRRRSCNYDEAVNPARRLGGGSASGPRSSASAGHGRPCRTTGPASRAPTLSLDMYDIV